jgi:murein hydrolase activator
MIRTATLILSLWAGAAFAQETIATAAAEAAARLSAASDMLSAADGAQDQIAALTETVRAYEEGLIAMRDGLRRVAVQTRTLQTRLDGKREEVSRLLGVLQMLDPEEAPLLLLHPSGALGTARAGLMLADVAPALQTEAEALRAELVVMAELRALQDSAAETLRQGLEGAQQARAKLAEAVSNRTDLPMRFTEDEVATALLVASTETLDAFASGLAYTIGIELATVVTDAAERKGTIVLPVQGDVLRQFQTEDAAGIVRPGIVIATRPRALVTAPVAATIRFRGPLLDYGNVVIIEPAADVLFVLAGMAEVFGDAGQVVPEGTPLGLMGGEMPGVDAILSETAQGGGAARSETLYLEVRDGQVPVNPADWFALE